MSAEVAHMRERLGAEEDLELEAMEALEEAEAEHERTVAELDAVRARVSAAAPGMQSRINGLEGEISELELQSAGLWEQVPADLQAQYRRLTRLANPVVAMVDGQCQGCHVRLTAHELQELKRGERSACQNCGRILVLE
jgi:predicted  nucleic acid-binding Zn-ribbon protein